MMKNLGLPQCWRCIHPVDVIRKSGCGSRRKSASLKRRQRRARPGAQPARPFIELSTSTGNRRTTDVTKVVDGEYLAAPVLPIGRLFIEIPRRPLPPREGAAFVAIQARELRGNHLDALLQPKRLAVLIDGATGAQDGARPTIEIRPTARAACRRHEPSSACRRR